MKVLHRVIAASWLGLAVACPVDAVERVSVSSAGEQANAGSSNPSLSADGQVIAFLSSATNLVEGDSNGVDDVFVRDRATGQTRWVSVGSNGEQANGASRAPSLSADGRYVAFFSQASNLVPDDTNELGDMFVHDRQTGVTERVSLLPDGSQLWPLSPEERLSRPLFGWEPGVIAGDGGLVLLPKIDYVYAGFGGVYTTVTRLFVRDRVNGRTEDINISVARSNGDAYYPYPYDLQRKLGISSDGRYIASSPASSEDVFLYDRLTNASEKINLSFDGGEEDSKCGIAYDTPRNVNRYQLRGASGAVLSADGSWVAFNSYSTNHVPDDTNGYRDVFLYDRVHGSLQRMNLSANGAQAADGDSTVEGISSDGRFVVFSSEAGNLVAGDHNNATDIFVRDRVTRNTWSVSVTEGGETGNGASTAGQMAADSHAVAFASAANNLVPMDTNQAMDIFMTELASVPPNSYPSGDLAVSGKVRGKAVMGRAFDYVIKARNLGRSKVSEVVLTQHFSSDVAIVSLPKGCRKVDVPSSFSSPAKVWDYESVGGDKELCKIPRGMVQCTLGNIKPKQGKQRVIRIKPQMAETLLGTAHLLGDLNDVDLGNNTALVSKVVASRP